MDVVRRDIESLGGRIEIATNLGQGSTFKMVMPLIAAN
jgi:chemotaxis protein histidine kinase CheA